MGASAAKTFMVIGRVATDAFVVSPIRKHLATNGEVEVADGLFDAKSNHSSSFMRSVGVDPKGNIEASADITDKAIAVDRSSPVRKQAFSVQVGTNGDIKVSDGFDDSMAKQSASLVRKVGVDLTDAMEIGEEILEHANFSDKASPIRKHAFSEQVANNGDFESSDGMVDSALQQSSAIVRNVGVDSSGNVEAGAHFTEKAFSMDKSSPIRKQALSAQGASNNEIEITDALDDSTFEQVPSILRSKGADAKGNSDTGADDKNQSATLATVLEISTAAPFADERGDRRVQLAGVKKKNTTLGNSTSSILAELTISSASDALWKNTAMVLQNRIVHPRPAIRFGFVGFGLILVLSIVTGCLAFVANSRDDLRNEWARTINSMNICGGRRKPVNSDSESESSSKDLANMPVHSAICTGLFWKLGRRFTNELRSHSGSNFETTDGFALLRNWDIRFFSLDVVECALVCSYVSQQFTSVIFEIKSIESDVMEIPIYQMGRNRKSRKSNALGGDEITPNTDYLEGLRQMGYDLIDSGSSNPENMFVFTICGRRNGETEASRSAGGLKWLTNAVKAREHIEEPGSADYMCLGSADRQHSKRWRNDIANLLQTLEEKEQDLTLKRNVSVRSSFQWDAEECQYDNILCLSSATRSGRESRINSTGGTSS